MNKDSREEEIYKRIYGEPEEEKIDYDEGRFETFDKEKADTKIKIVKLIFILILLVILFFMAIKITSQLTKTMDDTSGSLNDVMGEYMNYNIWKKD